MGTGKEDGLLTNINTRIEDLKRERDLIDLEIDKLGKYKLLAKEREILVRDGFTSARALSCVTDALDVYKWSRKSAAGDLTIEVFLSPAIPEYRFVLTPKSYPGLQRALGKAVLSMQMVNRTRKNAGLPELVEVMK